MSMLSREYGNDSSQGQLWVTCLSLSRTRSPTWRFLRGTVHFCLCCKYSRLQRIQNWFARAWPCFHCFVYRSLSEKCPGGGGTPVFCVRSIDGESMQGCSGSADTGKSDCALIIAETSAIRVQRTLWVKWVLSCRNIESRILLAMPIICSHKPPMWELSGGLNSQLHPWGTSSPFCPFQAPCMPQWNAP